MGHGSRGKYQLAGLRYGHEVSDDPLVRDSYGAALGDLLSEQRDYGARTSQYVAESCGAVLHLVVRVRAGALDKHFAHPLGGSHDVGGINRLVSADHHEALGTVFLAALYDVLAAEYVVLYGFYAVVFHKGYVLVGCGVDYYLGFVGFEDTFECFFVGDGADFDL